MDIQNTFLIIDTETGGLDADKHSLLSIAGVMWNPEVGSKEIFSFYVREPTLNISQESININRINLNDVINTGLTPDQAIIRIQHNIKKYFEEKGMSFAAGFPLITLAGHNIAFDISFLKRLFRLASKAWEYDSMFTHRTLDTCSIMRFLQLSGKIPGTKASSDELFKVCNINIPQNERHTALGDAKATAQALECLCHLAL